MTARIWMITGVNSGFGRAIATAALDRGDTVVAAVRRPHSVEDLIARAPERISTVELDVTDATGIEAAVAEVMERHGRIDVLVNNAGRGFAAPAETTTDEQLRELMDLHFFAAAQLTRAVLSHMRRQHSGAIVQMSSQGGRYSFAGISAYSAAKFALEGWSEALAAEVGARHPRADRRTRRVPHLVQQARCPGDRHPLRGLPRPGRAGTAGPHRRGR